MSDRELGTAPTLEEPRLEYVFRLNSSLQAMVDAHDGVRGRRIQALYRAADRNAHNVSSERLRGFIQSGGDFMLIRHDGVLELDSRLTICAHDGPLIDMVYRATVDLIPLFGGNAKRKLLDFNADQSTDISLRAHVSFETASGPYLSEGEDVSWVKKRYSQNLERAKRYEPLARNVHLGVGKLSFRGNLPSAIELEVFQVA